jgi:hypothetical protein
MGLAVPSERTVVLLAGLFKQGPHELVAGTDYPIAKRDRLPLVACRYTEVEFQVELLRHDLDWLGRIHEDSTRKALAAETLVKWESALTKLSEDMIDPTERTLLQDAKRVLCALREESRLSETHAIPVGGD